MDRECRQDYRYYDESSQSTSWAMMKPRGIFNAAMTHEKEDKSSTNTTKEASKQIQSSQQLSTKRKSEASLNEEIVARDAFR